jgi:hypothetical protein
MEITEQDKLILKQIFSEAFDDKIIPINERICDIDIKLGNHLVHTAADISGINTNLKWIKESLRKCPGPIKNGSNQDGKQNANIDWLTWGIRLIIGTLVVNVIGFIFLAIEIFKDKI